MGDLLKVIVMDLTIPGGTDECPIFGSMTQQFFCKSKFSVNEVSGPPSINVGSLATTVYTFVRTECGTEFGSTGIEYGVTIGEDYSGIACIRKYC